MIETRTLHLPRRARCISHTFALVHHGAGTDRHALNVRYGSALAPF
jgi:hypothetical protein